MVLVVATTTSCKQAVSPEVFFSRCCWWRCLDTNFSFFFFLFTHHSFNVLIFFFICWSPILAILTISLSLSLSHSITKTIFALLCVHSVCVCFHLTSSLSVCLVYQFVCFGPSLGHKQESYQRKKKRNSSYYSFNTKRVHRNVIQTSETNCK